MHTPAQSDRSSWLLPLVLLAAGAVGIVFVVTQRTPPPPPHVPDTTPTSNPARAAGDAAASQPTTQPSIANLPDYIQIIERRSNNAQPRVDAQIPTPGSLTLHTSQVKRLRLLRSELPFESAGSVVLRIDDQGIEWTRKVAVLDLELRPTGEWVILSTAASQP